MIYKLFSEKDATIYSLYSEMNTGMDEILELSLVDGGISRILIKFNQEDINNIILSSSNNYKAYLNLRIAEAYNVVDNINIEIWPLSGSWYMGTGKYLDDPLTENGVSWKWREALSSSWIPSIYNFNSTSSYSSVSGGGTWFTGSLSGEYFTSSISQSFSFYDNKDIKVEVTPIIRMWNNNTVNKLYIVFDTFYDNSLLDNGVFPKNIFLSSSLNNPTTSSALPSSLINSPIIQIVSGTLPTSSNQVSYPQDNTDYYRFIDDVNTALNSTSSILYPYFEDIKIEEEEIPYSPVYNTYYYYITMKSRWPLDISEYFETELKLYTISSFVLSQYVYSYNFFEDKNFGFLLKLRNEVYNINYQPKITYFSRDTHTIYPPYLEFKWDDNIISTSSYNTYLTSSDKIINIKQMPYLFDHDEKIRFRVYSRPKYIDRQFSTSSVYIKNYYLSSSSYAIKDLDTNEYIIDFDDTYTKLSIDSESNYFDLYMNGLEPQRYYKILIKTKDDGITNIYDNNNYFKII